MRIEQKTRKEVIKIGRLVYDKGFIAANDGNISVRVGKNAILITPTGISKGFMKPGMMVKIDLEGNILAGKLKPTSELKMHLEVYRQRPDIRAVLHAHPPVATAFAATGKPLDKPILPEIVLTLGKIPLARYGTPSTEEVPRAIREHIKTYDALLLENHGVLTVGEDLTIAFYKMERVEHFARISFYASLLGGEQKLPTGELEKLYKIREQLIINNDPL